MSYLTINEPRRLRRRRPWPRDVQDSASGSFKGFGFRLFYLLGFRMRVEGFEGLGIGRAEASRLQTAEAMPLPSSPSSE